MIAAARGSFLGVLSPASDLLAGRMSDQLAVPRESDMLCQHDHGSGCPLVMDKNAAGDDRCSSAGGLSASGGEDWSRQTSFHGSRHETSDSHHHYRPCWVGQKGGWQCT
ncbi:hypothetical protein BO70DRAFT_188494 [Aspergillus heteromorphus CBS 117.55]|uniref:Uncharacterized protein n=1 Tax=Aspergillus heteromorphus CBS 117.55 TaxID=1448321 RepID=A0A317UZ05_9EURO|nr:uncharacterized protein BO70DRAFT_188494 [Aspergillus heteromorphus CBS 117.55]PWY65230.1 hypothetical protein BO70DRAFT_188494 [Aspergillus heteromorphus CBS 117.55]